MLNVHAEHIGKQGSPVQHLPSVRDESDVDFFDLRSGCFEPITDMRDPLLCPERYVAPQKPSNMTRNSLSTTI